jgi:protocatechuate 4,5-dioxygenase beta chain
LGEKPEDHMIKLRGNPEFAWEVQKSLVDHGFDMNYMSIQNPLGRPEYGTSSAFTRPPTKLLANLDIPVTPIFINCLVEPAPSARRCHQLGEALTEILDEMEERVAILAVGGLSHDPNGARAGWVDSKLDKWVLDNIEKGKSERLKTLFDLDSDTLRGGTGQIRTWVAAAAAAEKKGVRAKVVDYIPALRTITGLAFAYWPLS